MDLLYTAAIRIDKFESLSRQPLIRSNTDPENYALTQGGSAVNYQSPQIQTTFMHNESCFDPRPSPLPASSLPIYFNPLPSPTLISTPISNHYYRGESSEKIDHSPIELSNPINSLSLLSLSALQYPMEKVAQPSSPTASENSNASSSDLPKGRGAHPFTATITRVLVETWNSGDFYPNDEAVRSLMNKTSLEREQIKGW